MINKFNKSVSIESRMFIRESKRSFLDVNNQIINKYSANVLKIEWNCWKETVWLSFAPKDEKLIL